MAKRRKLKKTENSASVRAGLDITKRSAETQNHWKYYFPETARQTCRPENRDEALVKARAEYLNNPYGSGFPQTFALYVVGTGPLLRFRGFEKFLKRECASEILEYVSGRWRQWADDVRLAKTLRTGMRGLVTDGEFFAMRSYNPRRKIFGCNLIQIDPLRIGNPLGQVSTHEFQDGIHFDEFGNPFEYCLYRVPKYDSQYYDNGKYDWITSDLMYHIYRPNLPGQSRGWSWFAPALESMGRLRDFEDGVIENAKTSANTIASIETQDGIFDGRGEMPTRFDDPDYYSWQATSIQRNRFINLPPGTRLNVFRPEQPSTNVDPFVAAQVARMGRSMGLTRNRATGSSHEYNFASGKLDNQPFEILVRILQKDLFEFDLLDKLFSAFYVNLLPDLYFRFPQNEIPEPDEAQWEWRWPTAPLIDPESQARTDTILFNSNMKKLEEIFDDLHPDGDFDHWFKSLIEEKSRLQKAGILKDPEGNPMSGTAIDEPKGGKIDDQTA